MLNSTVLTVSSTVIAALTVIFSILYLQSPSSGLNVLTDDFTPLKVGSSAQLDAASATHDFGLTSDVAHSHGFWRGLHTEGSLIDVTPGLYRVPESQMNAAVRREYHYNATTPFITGRFFESRSRNLASIRDLGRALERPMCKYCSPGTERNSISTEWESITGQRYPLSSCLEPVDVVFTWVNGSDPMHAKARAERTGQAYGDEYASSIAFRYRTLDEIRYAIRSVFSYLPWVRHVFLLTFGHKPYWMDNSTMQLLHDEEVAAKIDFGAFSPKVTVVPHSHIFARSSDVPTFSSMAIETGLHRIPGIAERLIYLNDDMFFTRHCQQSTFFEHALGPQLFFTSPEILTCSPGCKHDMLGDGHCDLACLGSLCSWDLGDCERNYASVPSEPAVYNALLSTLAHHATKQDPASYSSHDAAPARIVEGLFAPVVSSQLYAPARDDGVHAVLAAVANATLAQRLGVADAAQLCAPGCPRHWLGDGVCDDACDVAACEFDKSDCSARFSELSMADKTTAREKLLAKQEDVRRTFADSALEAVSRLRFAADAFVTVTPAERSASPAELRALVAQRRSARGANAPAPCVASQLCTHLFLALDDAPVTTVRSAGAAEGALHTAATEAMRQWALRSYHQRPFGFHHDFDHGFGVPTPGSGAQSAPRSLVETRAARAAAPVYSQSWSRKLRATGLDHEVPPPEDLYRSYITVTAVRMKKAIGNFYPFQAQHAHQTMSREVLRYLHALMPEEYVDGEAAFVRNLDSMQLQTVVMSVMLSARHVSIHTLAEALFSSADFDCSGALDRVEVAALLRRLVSGTDPDAPRSNVNIEKYYNSPLFPFAVPLVSLSSDAETWGRDATAETGYLCAVNSTVQASDIDFVSHKLRDTAATSARHDDDFIARLTSKARTAVLQDGSTLESLCSNDCEVLLRTQPWRLDSLECSDVRMTFDEFVSWPFARSVMQQVHLGNQLLFPTRLSQEQLDFMFLVDPKRKSIPKQMTQIVGMFTDPNRRPFACINDDLPHGALSLGEAELELYQNTLRSVLNQSSPVEMG